MIRRTFLKALAGIPLVGAAAQATPEPYVPQPGVTDPLDLFERIDFVPGSLPEFPLDLLHGSKSRPPAFVCTGHKRTPEQPGFKDFVYVPFFELAFCGKTREECVAGVTAKLRADAVALLLHASRANKNIRLGTVHTLARWADEKFGCKAEWFVHGNDFVAVPAMPHRHDKLVLCVREDTQAFDDPTHRRNPAVDPYYAFGSFGLAVLDSSVVLAGKVTK